MMLSMPMLRENIKQSSMSDLKDFLEQIRKHSQHIGETAMKHVSFLWGPVYALLVGDYLYYSLMD